MLQWNAVDTSPDVGDQNVLETFEMAIWHKRRTAQTELKFSVTGFTFTYVQKYFLALLGGRGTIAPSVDCVTLCVLLYSLECDDILSRGCGGREGESATY